MTVEHIRLASSDRESLDATEPEDDGKRQCPLCGHMLWAEWGWNPGEPIRCGGCGAHVKPVPFEVKP